MEENNSAFGYDQISQEVKGFTGFYNTGDSESRATYRPGLTAHDLSSNNDEGRNDQDELLGSFPGLNDENQSYSGSESDNGDHYQFYPKEETKNRDFDFYNSNNRQPTFEAKNYDTKDTIDRQLEELKTSIRKEETKYNMDDHNK